MRAGKIRREAKKAYKTANTKLDIQKLYLAGDALVKKVGDASRKKCWKKTRGASRTPIMEAGSKNKGSTHKGQKKEKSREKAGPRW